MTVVERSVFSSPVPPRPRLPRRTLFLCIGIVSLVLFLLGVIMAFRIFHARTGWAVNIARVVPYPAAAVDGQIIWYADVVRLAEAFDTNPIEGTDAFDASIMLLARRAVVKMYAEQWDISVSESDRALAKSQGTMIFPVTSWNEKTYERYVLDPLLLSQKVEAALGDREEVQDIALARLQKIQMDLQAGMDFEGIARYRSEDPSAPLGGDLGFFTRDTMPPGLESAFDLPLGAVSGILEEPDFFAIVKVYEERQGQEGERTEVGLRIISVHKATLSEVVDAYLADHPARYFVD